jgi:hypothetical protein
MSRGAVGRQILREREVHRLGVVVEEDLDDGDIKIGSLADAQVAQLRFLEIAIDPDLAERADRHQALSDLNVVARIDIAARDDAVDLRNNIGVFKVELGQSEVAFGGFELGLCLLDGRRLSGQHVEPAVDGTELSNSSSICFGDWL